MGLVTKNKSDKVICTSINKKLVVKYSVGLYLSKHCLKLVISNFQQRQRARDDYNDASFQMLFLEMRKKKTTFC